MTVLSLLQDPRPRGGVATFVHWYREWMDRNRPGERIERFLDEASSSVDYFRRWRTGDAESKGIPRLFPRTHVPQYVAGRRFVNREAAAATEIHTIGAMALHGTMAGASDAPMLVWLSTTVAEERRPQLPHLPFHRRAVYAATLSSLERLETSVLRRAVKVLVNSPYIAELLIGRGIASDRVGLLPVPIDTDLFTPGEAERTGALFVGRVHDPRKNYELLDRAMISRKRLRAEGLKVVSAVAPPARAGVEWMGDVSSLVSVYRSAKVLVLPSLQEGFGIVAFEALACGTPVVSLRCGGPDVYLESSGGAKVVDRAEDLPGVLEDVLGDDEERERMSAAGRAWVEAEISARRFLGDDSVFRL